MPVASTEKLEDPAGAPSAAETVTIALSPEVTFAGVMVALTPGGRPATSKKSGCAEPTTVEVDTAYVVEPRFCTLEPAGETEIAKSRVEGPFCTVTVTAALVAAFPEVS